MSKGALCCHNIFVILKEPPFLGYMRELVEEVCRVASLSPTYLTISRYHNSLPNSSSLHYDMVAADLTINKVRREREMETGNITLKTNHSKLNTTL